MRRSVASRKLMDTSTTAERNIGAAPPAGRALKPAQERQVIYRHGPIVRITHWINVLVISLLLMSGLQIFNAHPRLYWGQAGANFDRPFLQMRAVVQGGRLKGLTDVAGQTFNTTGVFGVSRDVNGQFAVRGFPKWVTLPSWKALSLGRRWHFFLAWIFVANGAAYLLSGLVSGHFRRDLAPTRMQLAPRHILSDIWDHLRFKHPTGEAAKSYNVLQKFAYLAVVFLLLPLMVATGLTLSPGFDAVAPWLLDLFGGRQSARTLHFITANLIVLFVIVHVVEVVIAGVFNEIGSMITGRYAIKTEPTE
jgi:thiosulfate reductase cytochrome b subunit